MGLNRRHVFACPLVIILAFAAAGVAQECKSKLNGDLLLGEANTISRLNPETGIKTAYASSPGAMSLTYDLGHGVLYWSDLETRRIYGLDDGLDSGDVLVQQQEKWLPYSIAHEAVTDKIYVVESFSSTVYVFDLERDRRAVIVSQNLTDAKSIAVDAFEGYLFLVDKFQIIRTDLDGKNRKVLLEEFGNIKDEIDEALDPLKKYFEKSKRMDSDTYRKDLAIPDVAVDIKTKRVYFVNVNTRSIESFDYDGRDRQVHFQDKSGSGVYDSLGKITLLGDYLYWADDTTQKIFKVNLNGGSSRVLLENVSPLSLKGVDCTRYRFAPNPCANNNGQCQHLCLLSRSNEDKASCACQVGYKLAENGKSCVSINNFVMFVENDFLRGLSLDGSESVIDPSQFEVGSDVTLDFDASENVVYYNSLYPNNKLHRVNLDTGKRTILTPDLLSRDVRDIAFDWNSKNLYYLSYYFADVTSLNVLNTRDPTYSKIVLENVKRLVRGIALHANEGYLYIAQLDDSNWSGTISRVATDGSNLKVIVKINDIHSLDGLTIDYDEGRVYWSEAKRIDDNKWTIRVRHSNLDGQDIQEISLPSQLEHPSHLAVYGDSIYAIGGLEQKLVRLNKRNPRQYQALVETLVSGELGELSGLKVFSSVTQQTSVNHPCVGDHGCAKFCFAVPSARGALKPACGCPYGERLAADGKGCEDNGVAEPPFKPCRYSFKCNKQTE